MADSSSDPEAVVQRQLEAYNAHDVDAFMGTYAETAEVLVHPSTSLAKGGRRSGTAMPRVSGTTAPTPSS